RAVAGLFFELARRSLVRVLARLEGRGGELEQPTPHHCAEVPVEQHPPVRKKRQDHHRTRVAHGVTDDRLAGGELELEPLDAEDGALEEDLFLHRFFACRDPPSAGASRTSPERPSSRAVRSTSPKRS